MFSKLATQVFFTVTLLSLTTLSYAQLSYQTCHLRELSFFGFLKTSLVDYIRTGEPMSLAQYEMEFGQISEKAS